MPGPEALPLIAFGTDEMTDTADAVLSYLRSQARVLEVEGDLAWPLMAEKVAEAVASGAAHAGIVMCWTGTGTAIAANKVAGVRAAQANEAWVAAGSRRWNDANVLALSNKRLSPMVAVECVRAFLENGPDPDETENIRLLTEM